MSAAPHVIRRTIRRQQLREIVPLADSTVYDMEQRGEFPQRSASNRRGPRARPGARPLGFTLGDSTRKSG